MTPVVVVDASALAAVAFLEPEAGAVLARLENRQLVAPTLLAYELTNTALSKLRRHPGDFAIYWSEVDHEAVLAVAEQTQLTAYDAAYLWLARHLHADLVTLDLKLQRAFDRSR